MHALTPRALAAVKLVRSPLAVLAISDAFRAASPRPAIRANVLDIIRDRVSQAASEDHALLLVRTPDWAARYPLTFMLALMVALPTSITLHPRPEPLIRRHNLAAEGPLGLQAWLRLRLSHLLE